MSMSPIVPPGPPSGRLSLKKITKTHVKDGVLHLPSGKMHTLTVCIGGKDTSLAKIEKRMGKQKWAKIAGDVDSIFSEIVTGAKGKALGGAEVLKEKTVRGKDTIYEHNDNLKKRFKKIMDIFRNAIPGSQKKGGLHLTRHTQAPAPEMLTFGHSVSRDSVLKMPGSGRESEVSIQEMPLHTPSAGSPKKVSNPLFQKILIRIPEIKKEILDLEKTKSFDFDQYINIKTRLKQNKNLLGRIKEKGLKSQIQKQIERAKLLEKRLEKSYISSITNGKELASVPSDGNCLFQSFLNSFSDEWSLEKDDNIPNLRRLCAEEIGKESSNPSYIATLEGELGSPSKGSKAVVQPQRRFFWQFVKNQGIKKGFKGRALVEKYCECLKATKSDDIGGKGEVLYGGELELIALSKIYQTPIVVLDDRVNKEKAEAGKQLIIKRTNVENLRDRGKPEEGPELVKAKRELQAAERAVKEVSGEKDRRTHLTLIGEDALAGPPILLYRNGFHYQSLKAKKDSSE